MQESRDIVRHTFLETQPLIQHVSHFNTLMLEWLPMMIKDYAKIDTIYEEDGDRYRYIVEVDNYRCTRQDVSPDDCHLRNMNYSTDITVDVHMSVWKLPSMKDRVTEQKILKKTKSTYTPDIPRKLVETKEPGVVDMDDFIVIQKKRGRKRKIKDTSIMHDVVRDEDRLKELDEEQKELVHTETISNHILMSFPNMLHSDMCMLSDGNGQHTRIQQEMGGSFILRGKRRFIPFLERLQYNIPFFFKIDGSHLCEIRSEHLDRKFRSTSTLSIVLNPNKKGKHVGKGKKIHVCIPYLKTPVPLHVIIIAFGWTFAEFEESMYQMDTNPEELRENVEIYMNRMRYIHHKCYTQGDALMMIANLYKRYDVNTEKLKRSIANTLHSEILPHLNHVYPDDREKTQTLKMRYISWICSLLFRFGMGNIKETKRDSYEHMVVDGAAELIAQLFRQHIINFSKQGVKTMRRALKVKPKKPKKGAMPQKEPLVKKKQYQRVKLSKVFNADRFTPKIMSAVSTGRWSEDKKGVSHAMKTTNSLITISQLRRVSSSILNNKGKHVDPRMVHPSSYGYICPAECFDPDTVIQLYNGNTKTAENIQIGDVLVDDIGKPTEVYSICAGESKMYDVRQENGVTYRVTDNHILTLKNEKHKTIDIAIVDYLALTTDEKHRLKGFKYTHGTIKTTDIQITQAPFGPFAGWQLKGNGRFLLSDYTVVHNTPEGEACGLVYTLALTCQITDESDPHTLMMLLLDYELEDIFVSLDTISPKRTEETRDISNWWKIIGPEGILHGWTTNHKEALRRVRSLRRKLAIDKTISIYAVDKHKTIYIKASGGRLTRPLLVMENIKKLPSILETYKHCESRILVGALLSNGVVEYLDVSESCAGPTQVCVAMDPSRVEVFHTHMEISDVAFIGICASYMPYFRHNQGPRLVYQIGMGKQYISPTALDDYGANTTHILHHGQQPLVKTIHDRPEACDGVNAVLAIAAHPRAQEDALVFKKSFVERGGFTSSILRTYTATHTPRNVNQVQDQFERPKPNTFGLKFQANYNKIQENGLPTRGTKVTVGDALIGKTIPHAHVSTSAKVKTPSEFKSDGYTDYRRDASVYIKKGEEGTVDEVLEAPGIRKVRVRSIHELSKGDKLSNRHGQKGTVGIIEEDINLPFCEDTGMVPDIVIGPTAIPSRMTMGMILEILVGKAVAISGMKEIGLDKQDLNANLTEENIKTIGDILKKNNFSSNGRQRMRDGLTGEVLNTEIFMGPIFYGKMDHMVHRKVHARSSGARQPITRQPTEGRRNNGGFRAGSMEIDVFASYGVSNILQERTVKASDEVKLYRCKQCGFTGDANPTIGLFMCRFCKTSQHMRTIIQSNSANIMFTELACNGVSTRFILEDIDE